MRWLPFAALLVLLAAGCAQPVQRPASAPPAAEAPFVPHVVVAIVDTGLNPYHDQFRQVRAGQDAFAHPSTYLPGYPAGSKALNLTLQLERSDGRRDTKTADYLKADQTLWNATRGETLYWIPGTKFVGMVGFGASLPGSGHGSMTATRAGGNNVSLAADEVLLVEVVAPLALAVGTVGEDEQARAVRWIADQGWVDIQSHSWGMPVTCAGVATTHLWGWAEAFKYARDRQLVMVAAGNGHGNTGTLGYPSQCQDNGGVAGVVTVGATDNAGYATWGNWFPALSGDGCANPAIDEATTDELANTGSGTSSATPFAAGGAARIILEARRILRDPGVGVHDGVIATAHAGARIPAKGPLSDGKLTLDELKDLLFHTAISPPTADPSDGDACLQQAPMPEGTDPQAVFPFIGYGEVNGASTSLALRVLTGEADPLSRPREDELYRQDQEARRAVWG